MTCMFTHGDLHCPACGYRRTGLEHPTPCPECGARGFHGPLVVSGQPETHRETRRAGCAFSVAHYLGMLGFGGGSLILGRNNGWEDAIGIATMTIFAVALAIWAWGWFRRRRESAEIGSIERIAWDFDHDGVRVREFATERVVPYADIKKVWVLHNFVLSGRTKVQLELRAGSPHTDGFPAIMLCGPLASRRSAADEIKRRVAAAQSAS